MDSHGCPFTTGPFPTRTQTQLRNRAPKIKQNRRDMAVAGRPMPWQAVKLAVWDRKDRERGCSGLRAFGIPRSATAKANVGCSKGVERRGEASGELSTAVWGNDARASMQQAVCGLQ